MLNRTSLLALAAVATLSVAALSSIDASARGFGGGFGGGHFSAARFGGNHAIGGNHFNTFRRGVFIRPGINRIRVPRIRIGWWKHWHYRNHFWIRPVGYTVGGVGVTQPVAQGPCTCLTKEYLPDHSVMFKDLCTNEAAVSPSQQAGQ
jgi:hypothetical protein